MAKDLGDYAELRYVLEAYEKGFSVLRPFSNLRPYDFVLEKHGRFLRIQVKSCSTPLNERGRFEVSIGKGRQSKDRYTADHCDIIAVYIKSLDIIYNIPVQCLGQLKVNFYPLRQGYRYNEFISNWNI